MEEKVDLRIQKTYLALHNAFVSLLEEKRFEDVTVNELCERAMIRRTTFYKHFADKYDYFSFYMREVTASFRRQLTPEIAAGGPQTYLTDMVRQLVVFLRQHEKLVQNVKLSSMFPVLLNMLVDQISTDVASLIRSGSRENMEKAEVDGIAAFYAGGLTNILFRYVKQDLPIDEETVVQILERCLPV